MSLSSHILSCCLLNCSLLISCFLHCSHSSVPSLRAHSFRVCRRKSSTCKCSQTSYRSCIWLEGKNYKASELPAFRVSLLLPVPGEYYCLTPFSVTSFISILMFPWNPSLSSGNSSLFPDAFSQSDSLWSSCVCFRSSALAYVLVFMNFLSFS